jgi:hypothetical protein
MEEPLRAKNLRVGGPPKTFERALGGRSGGDVFLGFDFIVGLRGEKGQGSHNGRTMVSVGEKRVALFMFGSGHCHVLVLSLVLWSCPEISGRDFLCK